MKDIQSVEYIVLYSMSAFWELGNLTFSDQSIVKKAVEDLLCIDPWKIGTPVRRCKYALFKIKIGSLNVVFSVLGQEIVIFLICDGSWINFHYGGRKRLIRKKSDTP